VATVLAALGALCAAQTAPGQQFPADPVQSLRQALKATGPDTAERDRALKKHIADLRDAADCRRALDLIEWRDEDLDPATAAVDLANREAVAQRLGQAVRAARRRGDSKDQLSAVNLLTDLSPSSRRVLAVGGAGPRLSQDLADLIAGGSPEVCEAAARALGQLNPDPAVAVPALERLLGAAELSRRLAAAGTMADLVRTASLAAAGRRAAGAVEVRRHDLVAVARAVAAAAGRGCADPDADVRRLSVEAIGRSAGALSLLVFDPRLRRLDVEPGAARAPAEDERADLLPLVLALKDQGPALERALEDPDPQVRLTARLALEDMAAARQRLACVGAGAPGPCPPANPAEQPVQPAACQVAGAPAADPLLEELRARLPALTAGVYDPDVRARRKAIDVLETLGPAAAPAAPALVRALTDPDRFVRWAAARTLGKIGPLPRPDVVPALERLLADDDQDVRLAAAVALARYGPAARSAVSGLIEALQGRDADLRLAAVRTLQGIGLDARPAIPTLREAEADQDPRVRQAAAELLREFNAVGRRP
jgi:HEAT repeat protein